MSTLKKELYETVRRSKYKVSVLSDQLGIGDSYLYKATTPGSGVYFPLEWLVPLMQKTKDYRALRHINRLCGFAEYKIPVKGLKKCLPDVAELQRLQGDLLMKLHAFYNDLSGDEKRIIDALGLIKALEDGIKALAAVRADVMKRAYGQTELFDGEDNE